MLKNKNFRTPTAELEASSFRLPALTSSISRKVNISNYIKFAVGKLKVDASTRPPLPKPSLKSKRLRLNMSFKTVKSRKITFKFRIIQPNRIMYQLTNYRQAEINYFTGWSSFFKEFSYSVIRLSLSNKAISNLPAIDQSSDEVLRAQESLALQDNLVNDYKEYIDSKKISFTQERNQKISNTMQSNYNNIMSRRVPKRLGEHSSKLNILRFSVNNSKKIKFNNYLKGVIVPLNLQSLELLKPLLSLNATLNILNVSKIHTLKQISSFNSNLFACNAAFNLGNTQFNLTDLSDYASYTASISYYLDKFTTPSELNLSDLVGIDSIITKPLSVKVVSTLPKKDE